MAQKVDGISRFPGIEVHREKDIGAEQFTYLLSVPFEYISRLGINVCHKALINNGSGLVRHLFKEDETLLNPNNSVRVIEGRVIEEKGDIRIFHESYDTHLKAHGLVDENGRVKAAGYLNGWRDMGQNPWHIFWENSPKEHNFFANPDEQLVSHRPLPGDRLTALEEDHKEGATHMGSLATGRVYTCMVYKQGNAPEIRRLRFDFNHDLYSEALDEKLSDKVDWAASGKPIVVNREPVDIYKELPQFYDIAHVVQISDRTVTGSENDKERNRDFAIAAEVFKNYPWEFKKRFTELLGKGFPRASYYFDVVGVSDSRLMVLNMQGTIEDVARYAISKGMKEGIIVDEGGSLATWAWYHGDRGGFENVSMYFRPSAISTFGILLAAPKM